LSAGLKQLSSVQINTTLVMSTNDKRRYSVSKKKIEQEVLDSIFFLLIEIELHDGKKKV
jgi:hypothetical protein